MWKYNVNSCCSKKGQALLDVVVCRAKKMGFIGLLLSITLFAELLTAVLNIINSYIWWGRFSTDLFVIGVIDAFIVSMVALPLIISVIIRLRQSDEQTDQNARYLDSILRSSTGMAIAATDALFRVTLINPAAEEMFGLSAGEVIGKDVRELHSEKQIDMGHFARAYEALHSTGRYTFSMEKEGGGRSIEATVSLITGGQGECIGYVMMARDLTEHKRAEAALRESESKFRSLVEQSLTGVAIIQGGRYAYVNPAHAEMLGYTVDEMMAMTTVLDVVHPDDKALVAENIRKRTEGEVKSIRYLFRMLRKDGSTVYTEVHGSGTEYNGRPAVISSALDITERVDAEDEIRKLNQGLERRVAERTAALVESEHSYRTLAENLPGMVYRLYLRESGRMRFFNDQVVQMTGYAAAELDHGEICSIDLLMLPEDRDEVIREVRDAVKARRPFIVEYRIRHKDGSERYFQERGKPVGGPDGAPVYIDGVILDVTKRKAAETALRESERRFRNMLENVKLVTVMLDEQARIAFCNDELLKLTGWSRHEVIDQDWMELFIPSGWREEIRHLFAEVMDGSDAVLYHENEIQTRSGGRRMVAWNNTVLRDANGAIIGLASIGEDITGRIIAQKEREAMLVRLNDAQKMEAVGALAGGIAHDFNNLLTVIRGDTELAMSYVEAGGEAYASLGQVKKAAERAAELTRKLLLFSRNRHVMPVRLVLNTTVADMVGMLVRLMGDGVTIETELEPGLPAVMADVTGMEQVIMNLVINARDSMPGGGTIKISTKGIELDSEGCKGRPGARAGRFVRLRVEDNGHGMDEETVKHIFEPFFTAKVGVKGTGLGLSVVHGVVKGLGGWVEVESAIGEGSRFDVYLEEAGQEGYAAHIPGVAGGTGLGRGGKILLVEDDAQVREFAYGVLSSAGYDVVQAGTAAEAMEHFSKGEGGIGLVFTDIVLPDKNGAQFVDELVAVKPGLPVLLASGFPGDKLSWQDIQQKGYPFLCKPYVVAELLDAVKKAVG